MCHRSVFVISFFVCVAPALCAYAFNEPVDVAGPLTARISGPVAITAIETPTAWEVALSNEGTAPISGTLHIGVIDDWRLEGAAEQPFLVPAGKSLSVPFTATAGKGIYNAWYPIHVRAVFEQEGIRHEAHPILLVRTDIADTPHAEPQLPWTPITIPKQGQRSLAGLPVHRVVVEPFDKAPIVLPVGWRGTEPTTRAVVHAPGAPALPEPRKAVFVHPPWFEGRSGALRIEIPVALPDAAPLSFECAVAIQQQQSTEPPSDGVTFRVYVASMDLTPGALGTLLFETHTDSKTWEPVSVDMSAYAGQTVLLQLETHPGPKRDTTCDRALWGDLRVVAGTRLETPVTEVEPIALGSLNEYEVQVRPGRRGLLDGAVSFTNGSDTLAFDGFAITVLNDALEALDGACVLLEVADESNADGIRIRHRFECVTGTFDVVGELRLVEGKALRATFVLENGPEPKPWLYTVIEDAALGAWNQQAKQIYAGVGNVIRNPEAFTLNFDGHQMATSFAGFDFAGGTSLVLAVDAPPSRFEVSPGSTIYTLHSPIQPAFTLIPAKSVWQGVSVWRDINGLTAADGVERLAGRFVFDLWGGTYDASADALEQAFRYGLVNSAVVWHNWQRWGYDYRLPDIFPPNPQFGTLEEFQHLAEVCRSKDVIFAPHDNYIDFYPDADGFSYKHIGFNNDGHPIWGWLNEGTEAQAFRWNADAFQPFLERNLALIRDALHPTGFFIDVWSSIGPYEAWTYDGKLQDRLLHRKVWGESFSWIRDFLGDNAVQISESGHDQLIGYLDGAQTNHLRVDPAPPEEAGWMTWPVRCEDAERIPWIDMAHHDRFVLHGAGYSNRYQGGLRADLHGIYSDDYITSEVLTGHPVMVSESFSRDVVRKYWLTNDLMIRLALKRIENVTFEGDNLHRQQVQWQDTGNVWVNRDGSTWNVAGHELPQYGYFADLGEVTGAIELKEGVVVEWSKAPDAWYVNARSVVMRGIPASVSLQSLRLSEDRSFTIDLEWDVSGVITEDLSIYVHFMNEKNEILFQADHLPNVPTSQWLDQVVTTAHGKIPDTIKPGDTLQLQVGLWKPGEGRRPLQDSAQGDAAIKLAQVQFEGDVTGITDLSITTLPSDSKDYLAQMNPHNIPVDFGGVITNGGCRILYKQNELVIVPLPDSPEFEVCLDLSQLPFKVTAPMHLECETTDGEQIDLPLHVEKEHVVIRCTPGAFAYRLMEMSVR